MPKNRDGNDNAHRAPDHDDNDGNDNNDSDSNESPEEAFAKLKDHGNEHKSHGSRG